ncbi:AcrR family transcriptional regulator [Pseudomonas fluvialis]|uniref:AcrR family transcriptional regulator n=1 Tax=Pseudomonas fluvialis TaxID=1793966 RepID=A0A7X0BVZ7_9PSED|nr:TetR family transcriptional regulator [Pseudomonas fluvialis]MBB6342491.1 AcrR family transcriptional regulator [Pseudomonas fluvialis]
MTRRARDDDAKQARRADILQAARRLFLSDERQLPSVARIAEAAGLAKGTVYLYFATKEEIFIALLDEEFSNLLTAIGEAFKPSAVATEQVQAVIARMVDYLDEHPEFLSLDALAYSVLEQNLPEQVVRTFKLNLTRRLTLAGQLLDAALGLQTGRGTQLLLRSYALIRGLWQTLDYPAPLQALLADPAFSVIRPPFREELAASLQEYWRGALTPV